MRWFLMIGGWLVFTGTLATDTKVRPGYKAGDHELVTIPWPLITPEDIETLSNLPTGEVDDSLYTYQPMDFSVDTLMNDFPKFAKLIVAVIVLVIVLLVALLWFVVRWVRRRSRITAQWNGSRARGARLRFAPLARCCKMPGLGGK